MLTREEILSGYKEINFKENLIEKSAQEKSIKNVLFYEKSTQSCSKKEKDTKNLSQSYVLPWRYVQKNFPDAVNKSNSFSRGGSFTPKEPLIEIKIDNFKCLYEKYGLPIETPLIYVKNNYGGAFGPFNLEQLQNLYKNKKVDSNSEFRTIDIFNFKDTEPFTFQSIKIINDEKWIESIIDSPLLKFNKHSSQNNAIEEKKEEKIEKKEEKKEEEKKEEEKKEEEKKPEEIQKKEEIKKEEDKKEEKKEDKKIEEKRDNEGTWEVIGRKKPKNKDDGSHEIIGLKTKESKEGKKGKKKKKGQFEDTTLETGFKVK